MSITIPTDAYCTVADVQQLLPQRVYSANSKPTLGQAEEHIRNIANEINAILRALGFAPPLTNTTDLILLRYINQLGSAYMCEAATLIGVQGVSELANSYKERYEKMLENLTEGLYKFAGAGEAESTDPDTNDDLDAAGSRSEPIFTMSEEDRLRKF